MSSRSSVLLLAFGLAVVGAACSGESPADVVPAVESTVAAEPTEIAAEFLPPTATPVPVPEFTQAEVDEVALAAYVASASGSGDEIQPVVAESNMRRVEIEDCVWIKGQVRNVARRTSVSVTVDDSIRITGTTVNDTGDCFNNAMIAQARAALDAAWEVSIELALAPGDSTDDPRIDLVYDELAASNEREYLAWLANRGTYYAHQERTLTEDRIAWRYMDNDKGVSVVYCYEMNPEYGEYNTAGERVGGTPSSGTGTAAFGYSELVPADTQFGWRGSGYNGVVWSASCVDGWLETAEQWQELEFTQLP